MNQGSGHEWMDSQQPQMATFLPMLGTTVDTTPHPSLVPSTDRPLMPMLHPSMDTRSLKHVPVQVPDWAQRIASITHLAGNTPATLKPNISQWNHQPSDLLMMYSKVDDNLFLPGNSTSSDFAQYPMMEQPRSYHRTFLPPPPRSAAPLSDSKPALPTQRNSAQPQTTMGPSIPSVLPDIHAPSSAAQAPPADFRPQNTSLQHNYSPSTQPIHSPTHPVPLKPPIQQPINSSLPLNQTILDNKNDPPASIPIAKPKQAQSVGDKPQDLDHVATSESLQTTFATTMESCDRIPIEENSHEMRTVEQVMNQEHELTAQFYMGDNFHEESGSGPVTPRTPRSQSKHSSANVSPIQTTKKTQHPPTAKTIEGPTHLRRFHSTLSRIRDSMSSSSLSARDLSDLCVEIVYLVKEKQIYSIENASLAEVQDIMLKQIRHCNLSFKENQQMGDLVGIGLECSILMFTLLTIPNCPKELLNEDAIATTVDYLKRLSRFYFFVDGANYSNSRHSELGKLSEVVELMNRFLKKSQVTDTILLSVNAIVIPSFFVNGIHYLQLSCLQVLQTVFAKYPQLRSLIFDDIFADLSKLPTSRKSMRFYRLMDQSHSCIQTVSALVMQLVHVCAGDSYTTAVDVASSFVQSFLRTCSQKSEYRLLLENFVEDLLTCVYQPLWPAAALLLRIFSKSMTSIVISRTPNQEQLRSLSVKVIGEIAAKLREYARMCADSDMLAIPIARSLMDLKEEVIGCHCRNAVDEHAPGLDCDRCHRWYHFACVEIDPDHAPAEWHCDHCLIWKQIEYSSESLLKTVKKNGNGHSEEHSGAVSDDEIDASEMDIDLGSQELSNIKAGPEEKNQELTLNQTITMKQLVLNYLSSKREFVPREFWLSQWDNNESTKEYYQSQRMAEGEEIANDLKMKGITSRSISLTSSGTGRILVRISLHGPLMNAYDSLLKTILTSMSDNNIKFRTKGVKALSGIVNADPTTLNDSRLHNAVKARLRDTSPLVREATVELIGKYILERPEIAKQYYELVSARVFDRGLAVRKRAIKISRDICYLDFLHPRVISTSLNLSSRLNDDEASVRYLVSSFFREMWFGKELHGSQLKRQTLQFISLVRASDRKKDSLWIRKLIKNLIDEENKKKKEQKMDHRKKKNSDISIATVLSQYAACLTQMLLGDEEELKQESLPDSKSSTVSPHPKTLDIFSCLNVLAGSLPSVLAPHLETLIPYLSSEDTSSDGAKIHIHVASISVRVLPLAHSISSSTIASLSKELGGLIKKSGMPVITPCTRLLCVLCDLKSQYDPLYTLLDTYTSTLSSISDDKSKPSQSERFKLIRSMFVLGNICKWFNFPAEGDTRPENGAHLIENETDETERATFEQTYHQKAVSETYSPQIERVYRECYRFRYNEEITIRVISLRSIAYPGLLLRSIEYLKESLQSSPLRVRKQALGTLSDFLNDEQDRMKEAFQSTMAGESDTIKDADTGITAGVIQELLPAILQNLSMKDKSLRHSVLSLLLQILNSHLIHPISVVEYLVALSTDQERGVAEKSMSSLQIILEKDPKLVANRAVKGIKRSYRFQTALYGKAVAMRPVRGEERAVESIFAPIFRLLRKTKTQRNNFCRSFVRIVEDNLDDIHLARYLTFAVATIPYQLQETVLSVLSSISRIIEFHGANILSTLKTAFSSEIHTVPSECASLPGLLYLLKLKSTLKKTYNINSAHIQSFQPGDQSQTTISHRSAVTHKSLTQAMSFSNRFIEGWLENVDQCKKLYQLFKRYMKDDEEDFDPTISLSHTTSKKRKRAGSGRKAASKRARRSWKYDDEDYDGS